MAASNSTSINVDNNNNSSTHPQEDEGMMIPVLTVLKNNEILKTIFIVKKITLFGRHPECDVLLRNPSVSRFHFAIIRSHPPSRTLQIKDFFTLHGTWLNGKRVEAGVMINIKEGDAFKVGASTRVYILSWVTRTRAFDPHSPFHFDLEQEVDQVPTQEQQEQEEIGKILCGLQDQSFTGEEIQPEPDSKRQNVGKKTLLQKDTTPFEVLNGFSVTETSHFVTKFDSGDNKPCRECRNRVLSPPCLQSVDEDDSTQKIEACPEAEMAVETNLFCTLREYLTQNICLPVVEAVQGTKMQQFQGSSLLTNIDPASFDGKGATADSVMPKESDFGCSLRGNDGARILNSDENRSLLVGEVILDSRLQQIEITEDVSVDSISDGVTFNVKDFGNQCTCIENMDPVFDEKGVSSVNDVKIEDSLTIGARISDSESTSLPVEEAAPVTKSQEFEVTEEVTVDSMSDGEKQGICLSEEVPSNLQAISKVTSGDENKTSESVIPATGFSEMETFESCVKATDNSAAFVDVCLRRGKAASSPQVRTRRSRFMSTSNVDTEVELSNEKDMMNKSIPKDLFSVSDDEEVFTPNKENFSPNLLHLRFMRKKSKLEEIKHSKSQRSHNSEANCSPNIYSDESISSISNKENRAPKVVEEWKPQRKTLECQTNRAEKQYTSELKKNRVERVPFQPLKNSGGKRKSGRSGPVLAEKSIRARNSRQISEKHTKPSRVSGEEQKRSWDMVVDTASLLNKESRKALQLLQGLKGTRLIIPRLVIRDLDSMKRRFRIFRSSPEASSALEWIEECTVNTKSWIHMQSSMDESRLIASTPLAPPQNRFIEEIASPTFVDHILDCALLYRRKENNRQLILLSEDITLKIEAMAEGLLCETVPEFHRSLVNPFSERFM